MVNSFRINNIELCTPLCPKIDSSTVADPATWPHLLQRRPAASASHP